MNRLVNTINTIIKNNPAKSINVFVINTDTKIKELPITNSNFSNNSIKIQTTHKFTQKISHTERQEIKYLESKSLENALKN